MTTDEKVVAPRFDCWSSLASYYYLVATHRWRRPFCWLRAWFLVYENRAEVTNGEGAATHTVASEIEAVDITQAPTKRSERTEP